MTDQPKIEARDNGPLVGKDVSQMVGEDGAAMECKPVMGLCRCGHSKTNPIVMAAMWMPGLTVRWANRQVVIG